jgi:hypothetical protein
VSCCLLSMPILAFSRPFWRTVSRHRFAEELSNATFVPNAKSALVRRIRPSPLWYLGCVTRTVERFKRD